MYAPNKMCLISFYTQINNNKINVYVSGHVGPEQNVLDFILNINEEQIYYTTAPPKLQTRCKRVRSPVAPFCSISESYPQEMKKAGGHIGRNLVNITIKMKIIVQKPLRIKKLN